MTELYCVLAGGFGGAILGFMACAILSSGRCADCNIKAQIELEKIKRFLVN